MSTAQLADVVADRLPLIASAAVILGVTLVIQYFFFKDPLANVPFVGTEFGGEDARREQYLKDAKPFYLEGFRMNKVHKITSPRSDTTVSIPAEFLEELKKLPDDTVSFGGAVNEIMAGKYTGIDGVEPTGPHLVKSHLTPALAKINPVLTEEVARTVREEFGSLEDWTEVNINSKLLRIVAIVSGRIFLGPELCHNEKYIESAIHYTIEVNMGRQAIFALPAWQRPFRAWFLPEIKNLQKRERDFYALIEPIVRARREARRSDPNYQAPDDMLTWLEDSQGKTTNKSIREIARLQLGLSFAAIHTTTMTTTNILYDLAAHPEMIPELREEAASALAAHGGTFTAPALHTMKKMDSVMKESMRMNPPGYSAFMRKVLKPFTLSNGQQIPAGVTIEVPGYGVSRDPNTFPNADSWDGLRFFRLRESGETIGSTKQGGGRASAVEVSAQNQFVSVSKSSLGFGYGRHACPGRFFASNEVKMILARLVLNYDMKLPAGETERYKNIEAAGASVPDPYKMLLFKERA
ncbi:uncharacterized protein PgNI_04126 [Pyricularia grisea]|uniref:Uncharacterized protein n=1 Tax=Pyricularia grisea TaxID=148305 RepID=A0A6P8BAC9_PYRGI|nr:uncharacterized protein PgNI_04126 [Pyricularia grisea]TLD12775.1 hypothetical protein PgNI_04126 [Pyricularia grisea]